MIDPLVQSVVDGAMTVAAAMRTIRSMKTPEIKRLSQQLDCCGSVFTREWMLESLQFFLAQICPQGREASDERSRRAKSYLAAEHAFRTFRDRHLPISSVATAMEKFGLTYTEYLDTGIKYGCCTDRRIIEHFRQTAADELRAAINDLDMDVPEHRDLYRDAEKELANGLRVDEILAKSKQLADIVAGGERRQKAIDRMFA